KWLKKMKNNETARIREPDSIIQGLNRYEYYKIEYRYQVFDEVKRMGNSTLNTVKSPILTS
uniref:hypothetical protein n=1 Tax=uncultured Brevibacillus sp. TaxID=169970 RepID=UPI0025957DD2